MGFEGKFMVLDGGDGCGKSTQAKMLREYVSAQGVEAVAFRDPGGTEIGEKIRDILLDPGHHKMGVAAELLLYMAARAQLWVECISPALDEGKCVVMDRWLSSTCAYQGYAGGAGIETILKIAADSLERVWPDVVVVLDVDLETAAARMDRELDRMEQKGDEYHEKVRQGFLKVAEMQECVSVVDATKDVDDIHKTVVKIIENKIGNPKS